MTMASILMSDLVPIEIRGTYQSFINILFGVGATTGAATGGAIADSLGWRVSLHTMKLPQLLTLFEVGILHSTPCHSSVLVDRLSDHSCRYWYTSRYEAQDTEGSHESIRLSRVASTYNVNDLSHFGLGELI